MKGMALPFKRVVKLYRITIVFFLLGSIQTNSHIYPLLNSMARNLGNLILKHSIILICRNGTCLQFLSHLTFSPHVHTHTYTLARLRTDFCWCQAVGGLFMRPCTTVAAFFPTARAPRQPRQACAFSPDGRWALTKIPTVSHCKSLYNII